jgi:predicted alpha/beta hydrolase
VIEEPLIAQDGATSTLRIFEGEPAAPVIVGFPAMGAPARFYDRLGASVAARGLNMITTELRGVGSSSVRPARGADFGYWTMLDLDWRAAIDAAKRRFSGPRYLLGHSLGGQLSVIGLGLGLDVQGLITVASCSIDWRGFGAWGPGIWAFTQASRGIAELFGYYPGDRIGFGGRAARGVIRDWSHQGRTGKFAPIGAPFDLEEKIATIEVRVLGVSVDRDSWAPVPAVERLLAKLPKARIERLHYAPDPSLPGRSHFSWAKDPDRLVAEIDRFVRAG